MKYYIVRYTLAGEVKEAKRQTLQEAAALALMIDVKPCCDFISLVIKYEPIKEVDDGY